MLLWVAPAVAEAAMETGVARRPITDLAAYRGRLEAIALALARGHARGRRQRRGETPKRIVFPKGEDAKILRAAKILVDEGIAKPILLARRRRSRPAPVSCGFLVDQIEIIHTDTSSRGYRPSEAARAAPAAARA